MSLPRPVLYLAVLWLLLPSMVPGAELPRVAPGDVGLAEDKLDAVTAMLQQRVEQRQIAGAVAIVLRDGKIAYSQAVGMRDRESGHAMTEDTMFRIASMTKPVTTVAVMILYDEGKLDLDDPVSKFIPEFAEPTVLRVSAGDPPILETSPAEREITLHDLLTHTSGIAYGFLEGEEIRALYRRAGVTEGLAPTALTTAENVERIAGLPLKHQPGAEWTYGLSIDVLGRVVEVVSGQPLDQFFETRIFEPLGMEDTHFYLPRDKRARVAMLYQPGPDQQGIQRVDNRVLQNEGLTYSADFQSQEAKDFFSGGAGLVSTAADYARFLQMLLNEGQLGDARLLKSETVAMMTSNQIGDKNVLFPIHGDKFGYGFGVASAPLPTGASAGSYSWGGIFNTFFWVDPEQELVGIVMTQLYPFMHLPLWPEYQQLVYESVTQPNE